MSKKLDLSGVDDIPLEDIDSNELDLSGVDDIPLDDDTSESEDAEITPTYEEMSALEAAITSLGEGATVGLGPILAGGAGAVGEIRSQLSESISDDMGPAYAGATGSIDDLRDQLVHEQEGPPIDSQFSDVKHLDEKGEEQSRLERVIAEYYKSRDKATAQQSKAFKDQPAIALGGNIAGGIATTPLLGVVGGALSKGGKISQVASKVIPSTEKVAEGAGWAQKALLGVKEGAKAGGLTGFGSGKGKLIDEDQSVLEGVVDVAKDTAIGTAVGGLTGGAFSTGASGIKTAGKGISAAGRTIKDMVKNSRFGTDIRISKVLAEELGVDISHMESISKLQKGFAKQFKDAVGETFEGRDKDAIIKKADDIIDEGINVQEKLDNFIDGLEAANETDRKKLEIFKRDLKSKMKGYNAEEEKIIKKMEKSRAKTADKIARKEGGEIRTATEGETPMDELLPLPESKGKVISATDKYKRIDPETGEPYFDEIVTNEAILDDGIPIKQYDYSAMKPTELQEEISRVGTIAFPKDGSPGRQEDIDLYHLLNNKLKEVIGGSELKGVNEEFTRLFKSLKVADIDKKKLLSAAEEGDFEQLRKLIKLSGDKSPEGEFTKNTMLDLIGKVDMDARSKGKDSIEAIKKLGSFMKEEDVGVGQNIINFGYRLTFGNAAKLINKIHLRGEKGREAMQKLSNKIIDFNPEQIQGLTKIFKESGIVGSDPYTRALEKAAAAENKQTSKTILYGITQQPGFRAILKRLPKFASEEALEQTDRALHKGAGRELLRKGTDEAVEEWGTQGDDNE